jgi:hypothetical protein
MANVVNLTMYEIYKEYKDAVNKLIKVLIYHLKRNSKKCHSVLKDWLTTDGRTKIVDSTLDRTVVTHRCKLCSSRRVGP